MANPANLARLARSPVTTIKPGFSLKCGLVNCRSVVNKIPGIPVEIVNDNLDVFALTEAWLDKEDSQTRINSTTRICFPIIIQDHAAWRLSWCNFKKYLSITVLKTHAFQSL